jgi:hypothetical protein
MENQEIPVAQSGSNIIHYVAYSVLTLALLALAYLNFMPQKTQSASLAQTAQNLEFQDLPYRVQLQYKTNEEFKKIEAKLNVALEEKQAFLKEIASLQEEKAQALQTASQTTQETIKKAETTSKEPTQMANEPTLNINYESSSAKDVLAKRVKDFAKCYDMEVGKYSITSQCRKNIIAFVDKHKNAKYFEIIGIIDETEFTLYKNLEINNFIYDKLKVTQHTIDTMKKLSQSGLAKLRAVEGNWVIKSHTNKKAQVYNANYNLLSNDGKKGFVIRAYE